MKLNVLFAGFVASVFLPTAASTTFADGWQLGPDMPLRRNATGAAKDAEGRIYIPGGADRVGGTGPVTRESTVMRYDETTGDWEVLSAELNIPRANTAVASDQLGRIYVIGGLDANSTALSSVERFDPSDPCAGWAIIESLDLGDSDLPDSCREPRVDAMAGTDSTGNIYLVGGAANPPTAAYDCVLYFDPSTPNPIWQHHSTMNVPRSVFGFAIDSQDRMYALGGWDGSAYTDTVERYDPVQGIWASLAPLGSAKIVGVGLADCNDHIYAIGGWANSYTATVERYDPVTEGWDHEFNEISVGKVNMAGISGDSGRLYLFGGDAGSLPQATVEFLELPECESGNDSDGDGVPDEEDECPNSDLGAEIVIDDCETGVENQLLDDGCTMADLIMQCADDVVNHGAFVRCVSHLTNLWKCQGIINGGEKGAIMSCAGQSSLP